MSLGPKLLISVLVVLVLFLQYKLWFGQGSLGEIHRLQQEIAAQKAENANLKDSNEGLSAEVKALKKGTAAVEELARSRLGMIRQGDTFYQYVTPVTPAEPSAHAVQKGKP